MAKRSRPWVGKAVALRGWLRAKPDAEMSPDFATDHQGQQAQPRASCPKARGCTQRPDIRPQLIRHVGACNLSCHKGGVHIRSAGLLAARAFGALRHLTRRMCSSAVSAANVASYAPGQKIEHRRAPAAKRRASRLSPAQAPPGALRAPMPTLKSRRSRTAAMGRKPLFVPMRLNAIRCQNIGVLS